MSYRGNVRRMYAFTALTHAFFWMPVWVLFLQGRGLSLGRIGGLEFGAMVLMAVAEVPTGTVADTWGRKTSLAIGAFLHGLATLGVLAEVLSPVFLLAYAFWGASLTFLSGASEALLYDSLKAEGDAAGYTHTASRMMTSGLVGLGAASLVGGLVAAVDPRLCFVLTSVACFAGVGVALTLREPPAHDHTGESVEQAVEQRAARYWSTLTAGVRLVTGHARVRVVVLVGAALDLFGTLLTMTAFQPYVDEVALPVWTLGGILLAIRLCAIAGSVLSPRVADAIGREPVLVVAAAIMVGAQLVLWLGASRPAVALFALAAAAAALARPVVSALLNDAIPSSQRATCISLQSLVGNLGLGVVQLALFLIADWTNIALALGLVGLLMAAVLLPLLVSLTGWRQGRLAGGLGLRSRVP